MFKGIYTALVTPMADGVIDDGALVDLIEWQIEEGVHGLVMAGTTGEAVTLSPDEYRHLLICSVEAAKGRVPIIAGTGAISTWRTIENTRLAKELGAAAALVVTPYFIGLGKEGVRAHYEALNAAVDLPIIVYNVPSRTGVDVDVTSMAELSRLKNIVAVKDATNDLERPALMRAACADGFALLGGENGTFGSFLSQGGDGGILVTSNVTPRALRILYDAWRSKDIDTFERINSLLMPLHTALFSEANPQPVKYALSRMGKIRNELRLPLCQASAAACGVLDQALCLVSEAGYITLAASKLKSSQFSHPKEA